MSSVIRGDDDFDSADAVLGQAKAFVSYDKEASTILSSFNVSSVVDDGTGLFTTNFSITFDDLNYLCVGTVNAWDNTNALTVKGTGAQTTTSYQVCTTAVSALANTRNDYPTHLVFYSA